MAKGKTVAFFCQECGYESAKWLGQCPSCKAWNTLVEELVVSAKTAKSAPTKRFRNTAEPCRLSEITAGEEERISTGLAELDRVLGGGIVPGSLILVGGDPGIGKSTLLLQICHTLADGRKVIYISGEESLKQIKLRADRLGSFPKELLLMCETSLESIAAAIEK